MKKRLVAMILVLTLAMTTVLAVGCGSNNGGDGGAPAPDTPDTEDTDNGDDAAPVVDGDVTTINIWFMGGSPENDDSAVVEAANARLQELGVNVAINPIWAGGWGMGDAAQTALDTGDTSIDILWTGSWGLNFWQNARIGNFIRLDDPDNDLLARYGQDLRGAVPQALWDAFTTEGPSGVGIYGIPGYKDYAQMYTWDVNNTRLEELGFDFDDLFDMDGLNYDAFFDPLFEEALAAAKDTWGDSFYPLSVEPEAFLRQVSNADFDLTGLHIFHLGFDPSNPALPENPTIGLNLENELYLSILERLHHFFEQGYIDPRLAIADQSSTVFMESRTAGDYLFSHTVYAYGHSASAASERGIDVRFPPMSSPLISSVSAAGSGFGISVFSQNQEAAMQFMNAWYTDTELAVILTEGIEGIHWNYDADGLIVLDHDARASYSTWRFGMGNIFVLNPRDTDGIGYFERFNEYNAAGVGTALLGFTFNTENVSAEMAAVMGVVDQYNLTLTVGAVNPAEVVEEYLEALRANGVDRILEEFNAQLQAFYASR